MSGADALPLRVKSFYQRVNTERERALDELTALYADDLHFINPVVDQRGRSTFLGAWTKAFRMYTVFEFTDIVVTGSEELFTMVYSMNIRFAIGPTFRTDMVTECRGRDGRVYYCRDYFDPLGTLVGPLGPLRWLYRVVFRRLIA